MDDILSQGEDREPSRRPRRLAVIATAALVAVAGIAWLSLARHPRSPASVPPASAAAATAPGPAGLAGRGLPAGPGGPALPWAASLRLPVAGTQPAWFSPASGRSEPIGGLPVVSSGYQFTRVDGGWAVQANSAGKTASGDHAVPPLPVWFLADGTRSVTRVGMASQVTPAAAAGAVWLTSFPSAADTGTVARTAREVSLAGAPLGPPVSLPAGYVIYRATDRGLLLAVADLRPGTPAYQLWDPAHPRAGRTFDDVIAASPAAIAWTPPCAATCQVRLLDLADGRQTAVGLPAGSSAVGGTFSPGGDLLALQVNSDDDGALVARLEVASVTSGRLAAVPGTLVSGDALAGFGWPASGDSLVAEFMFTSTVQLASWQPGATRLAVAAVRPGQDRASLVVG
jgi:hypothetical protein